MYTNKAIAHLPIVDDRVNQGFVRLRAPGTNDFIEVSSIRVRADSISAWWPLESQDGVQVNYLPAPDA